MSYRVTIHSAAPAGHHGTAKFVSYEARSGSEAYARTARQEDPTATIRVDGQHEPQPVTLERAREWMTHIVAIWAAAPAFTDHNHRTGWQDCPICGRHLSHNDLTRSL